jgi:hypothetical protein
MDHLGGKPPDDIFALFSRFDLDISNYRVFELESPAVAEIDPEIDSPLALASALSAAQQLATASVVDAFPTVETPANYGLEIPSHRQATPKPSQTPDRMREFATVHHTGRTKESRQKLQTGGSCIQVFGAAGGVGVTTLVATLSRYLSHEGHRCGVYGGSKPSILPLFYGARAASSTLGRFAGLRALYQPTIKLLSPASLPEQHERAQMQEGELLHAASLRHGSSLNTLLIDNGCEAGWNGPGLRICVATPDVASVFGVQNFFADAQHHAAPAICVLNRFEADNILHAEVRSWFAEHFTTLLTISQSRVVAEALAEGCTILDWLPEASVALDFERVAEAVMALSVTSHTHTQKEAVLCS